MSNGIATTVRDAPADGEPTAGASADTGRLETMFRAHHALVWRTLRRRGLDADAAADATQQCFLIAAERLVDIRGDRERSFLLGTALRLALTTFRAMRRWQSDTDPDLRALPGLNGEEAIDQRRAVELLDRALGRMQADLAEVFVLFELEQSSMPEIANLLDIPVGTVASRLRRARESFRDSVQRMERVMRREVMR